MDTEIHDCEDEETFLNAYFPLRTSDRCRIVDFFSVMLLGLCLAAQSQEATLGLSQAVAQYQKAVDDNPTSAEAHLNLGLAYLSLDATDQAEAAFESALRLNSNDTSVYYRLGGIYYLQEKYEKAIAVLERAIHLFPDWDQAHAQLGIVHFQRHNYDRAHAEFEKAFLLMMSPESRQYRTAPSSPQAGAGTYKLDLLLPAHVSYFLGRIAFERGKVDQAAEHYERAISLGPPLAKVYFQLGLVYLSQKQEDEAVEVFQEAIRIDAQMEGARYQLGLLYFKQGKTAEAATEMERYRQIKGHLAAKDAIDKGLKSMAQADALSIQPGWEYSRDKIYDEAIQQFNKALTHDPNASEAFEGLAHIYAMQGRIEEAIAAQQHVIELEPELAAAYTGLGSIWFKKAQTSKKEDEYERAHSAYRKALEFEPDSAVAWQNLGNIAFQLSRFHEAQEAFEKLLSFGLNDSKIHLGLARVYLRQGMFRQAAHHYKQVVRNDPDLAEPYYILGAIAVKEGQLDEGADNLNAALKRQPDMADAHYFLGTIYTMRNQIDEAEQAYQRAISLGTSFHHAYERLAHLYGAKDIYLDRALELAQKAVELQPNSAEYLNTLSWLYYRSKNYAKAEDTIQKALTLQPDNPAYQQGLHAIRQARRTQSK
jgi:tetratricopeptide (TPR) repeat protein